MLLTIINPVAGSSSAPQFFAEHVLPRLSGNVVRQTERPGHAAQLVRDATPNTVIVGSGDSTLHEIINGIDLAATPVDFVLVPCGTANALYVSLFPPQGEEDATYKLQSLEAYLENKPPRPLTIATTKISAEKTVRSCVVVSTALHAWILKDSEALRASHPGTDRFKIAAQQNSTKWYNAKARLFPVASAGAVQIYDSASRSFVLHPDSQTGLVLGGPFFYFISTVNVDRLEPAFRISPLAGSIPPPEPVYEVVIVRPLRDPSISGDTEEGRAAFVAKLWQVVGAAYNDGAHVDLRYAADGKITPDGDGPLVVEYLRCSGYEWIPEDDGARQVCCDGALFEIAPGDRAACVLEPNQNNIRVYS